eukprot:TRINITY_DN52327_c0_g1_i1.p1 TRINITY_DN52327_c0_g1~~TRINITY_DN52327_c0_g1_i1.p1  ORF type:complete len:114 (-),score=18.74 TRINITY_DN52327_c0_g1_i1:71-412(-)
MLVELKSGATYNGKLENCDNRMNIILKGVICTSKDGDRFWSIEECYIRGNTIKYLCIPPEVLENFKEDPEENKNKKSNRHKGRSRGGRGRGRGGRRGGYSNRGRGSRGKKNSK